ncbi:RNA polymerase sigma factor [Serpentinicella alkaliphila]|uniref:RNA polymerase sigma-70 factor (ECF subfamily) n=1 Tax=Serpentinicella alkaliphila TaxID=1734049 RepID=A0A4R2TLH3_9FIRM|nr:sigma factor [Serpentinicella alkaliphila]QUH24697.1 RNA polymerase subunit sigma-24 [Serpentinicella alkaliphila]TCQ03686.1 RNA polymerase sigma-70 factor (ECF subfamily) [Serpentinicella alkaliphila]
MQTEVLISRAKLGDKEALIKLIMLKQQEYYKLAYVYMKNEADALDALEDMIVILYENISNLKNEGSFYSWSKTILVNRCKKILKEKSKVILVEKFQEKGCESDINQKDDQLLLEEELSKLSEKHKEVT